MGQDKRRNDKSKETKQSARGAPSDKSAAEAATRERNTEATGVNAAKGIRSNKDASSESSWKPISEQNKTSNAV
jgi:hypothetical protein